MDLDDVIRDQRSTRRRSSANDNWVPGKGPIVSVEKPAAKSTKVYPLAIRRIVQDD